MSVPIRMTPEEFQATLTRLALDDTKMASLVGRSRVSINYFRNGQRTIPQELGILLRLIIWGEITSENVTYARDNESLPTEVKIKRKRIYKNRSPIKRLRKKR